jgi:hypothetical protein
MTPARATRMRFRPNGERLLRFRQHVLAIVVGQSATTMRRFALGVLALQVAACLAATLTLEMLHGDGAYFVYALSVGQPWILKWGETAARATTYLLTVAPTLWIAGNLDLGPLSIASLNGFLFYLVPAVQFAAACALVWGTYPKFLIFPIVQYALSSAMGFAAGHTLRRRASGHRPRNSRGGGFGLERHLYRPASGP